MPDTTMDIIEETLEHFRQLLASDGGKIAVLSYEDDEARLTLEYNKGRNDHCVDCVISHDHLQVFIREALETRHAGVKEVKVVGE